VNGGDPRAEELNSLRLALATFALKLDALEARFKIRPGQTLKGDSEPDLAADREAVASSSQTRSRRSMNSAQSGQPA
jgi:hypothetical protein